MFNVKRSENNPIISPDKRNPWEAAATFNWCPIKSGRKTYAVYRAMSDNQLLDDHHRMVSVVARAVSKNGEDYEDRIPFITPEEEYEKYGCEDPRVTKIDGTYYIFYTALSNYPFNADGIKVAVALSKDMEKIEEKHLVTPFNAKAMTLFSEKVNGKLAGVLTVNSDLPPSTLAYVEFDKPEDIWDKRFWDKWYKNLEKNKIPLLRGSGDHVEVGAAPIKTKEGWLMIYSHIQHYTSGRPIFGIEAALLDLKDPRKIIGRTNHPFIVPETYYEKTGIVPNIVFPSGALVNGKNLEVYYGGADTHCAKATLPLQSLIDSMLPKKKEVFKRHTKNPIILPRKGKEWEKGGTINAAVIELDKKIHILYRAATVDNFSTIGYASSKDGFKIDERSNDPIYIPRTDFENRGCEDPRIVEIGSRIYMTYSGYDGKTPRVTITSISKKDFIDKKWDKWDSPQAISQPLVPNKDAALIPEKINNMYYVFHRVEPSICLDMVPSLDFSKEKISKCIEVIEPRSGMWDHRKVGLAGPSIKTKHGWLTFYHGISEDGTYRVGAMMLDLKRPMVVLSRTALPIFEPEKEYEKKGIVSNVVFPCGTAIRDGKIYMYYGAADYSLGVATADLKKIIDILVS